MPTRYRIQRITQPNGDISHWVVQRKGLFGWRDEKSTQGYTPGTCFTVPVQRRFYSEQDAHQYIKTQTRAQRCPSREVVWESPSPKKTEWSQGARLARRALSSLLLCAASFALYPSFFCVVSIFLALVVFVLGLWQ